MKKRHIIVIGAIIMFVLTLIFFPTTARADDGYSVKNAMNDAERWVKGDEAGAVGTHFRIDNFKKDINIIFNILFTIGVGITVIVGGILGIKFMMASAEDKANIKELMIPYIAGCVVIYGAFGIWKLVVTVGNRL